MSEESPQPIQVEGEALASKKKRKLIADLPLGISVKKISNGYFRVRIGKRFTGKKAEIRDFTKLKSAQDWITEQIQDKDARRGMQLSPTQIAEAKTAFQRLGDISLTTVVDYYLDVGPGTSENTRLKTAQQVYLQHHRDAGNKLAYINAQETSLNVLISSMGNKHVSELTASRLDAWLRKIAKKRDWGDLNLLNYVRDYRMFFKFCLGRNYIVRNPFDDHIFIWLKKVRKRLKDDGKSVEIYSVEECKQLLQGALDHPKLDLLPWFTTAFFTGARVDELGKITWDLFRWDDKIVSIPKGIASKRGSARHIEFTEAFESWIEQVPTYKERSGEICSRTNLRNRLDALFSCAKVTKKRNGLRHTFASYYYVWTDDAEATRRRMGQKTEQILFDHYISLVDKKAATSFWSIRPDPVAADNKEAEKI